MDSNLTWVGSVVIQVIKRNLNPLFHPSDNLDLTYLKPFPGVSVPDYSRVAYESVSGGTLFTYEAILSMCTLESVHMKRQPEFRELCETKVTLFYQFTTIIYTGQMCLAPFNIWY